MKSLFVILLFSQLLTVAQQPCTDTRNPVIFVHGFLGSGDTWATQVQRFTANGYCPERLFVFDWNTVGGNRKTIDSLLNVFIDSVLVMCKSPRVDLVGHSAGGGLCYAYLADSSHAVKVSRYVHVGSGKLKSPAGYNGNVQTMIISSDGDKVTGPTPDVEGVKNIRQASADHLEVATNEESFREMYAFFNDGKMPLTVSVSSGKKGRFPLSGRAVVLGENTAVANDSMFIFAFDHKTGKRKTNQPLATLVTNASGYWGPWDAPSGEYLEFIVHPSGGRVVTYFTEPQVSDNHQLYLRCLPVRGFAANLFKSLPSGETQSAIAIFSANRAVIYGRDTLAINDMPLSSAVLTPASRTTIASFLFDDGDGISSGSLMKSFGTGIFLNGIDLLLEAGPGKSARIMYNGRSMVIPCMPGQETVMVAVFN